MAQYKVPQDVEADDKLIGPFSFRQFVYLLVAAGLVALAAGLFQIFPALAIIPVPFILLFLALALPIKKDQPMETYLAAVISYYLKPHNRVWTPGQRESTIDITAPRVVDEDDRSRSLSGEEVTHRLSFLADIVDTKGRAIDEIGPRQMNEDLINEANTTSDMFESGHFERLESTIAKDENERHQTVMAEMRQAIAASENKRLSSTKRSLVEDTDPLRIDRHPSSMSASTSTYTSAPKPSLSSTPTSKPSFHFPDIPSQKEPPIAAKPSIIELANNPDYSVATIAKEAKRMKKEDDEVYISLH